MQDSEFLPKLFTNPEEEENNFNYHFNEQVKSSLDNLESYLNSSNYNYNSLAQGLNLGNNNNKDLQYNKENNSIEQPRYPEQGPQQYSMKFHQGMTFNQQYNFFGSQNPFGNPFTIRSGEIKPERKQENNNNYNSSSFNPSQMFETEDLDHEELVPENLFQFSNNSLGGAAQSSGISFPAFCIESFKPLGGGVGAQNFNLSGRGEQMECEQSYRNENPYKQTNISQNNNYQPENEQDSSSSCYGNEETSVKLEKQGFSLPNFSNFPLMSPFRGAYMYASQLVNDQKQRDLQEKQEFEEFCHQIVRKDGVEYFQTVPKEKRDKFLEMARNIYVGPLNMEERINKIMKYKQKMNLKKDQKNSTLIKYEKQHLAVMKKQRDKNGKFLKTKSSTTFPYLQVAAEII